MSNSSFTLSFYNAFKDVSCKCVVFDAAARALDAEDDAIHDAVHEHSEANYLDCLNKMRLSIKNAHFLVTEQLKNMPHEANNENFHDLLEASVVDLDRAIEYPGAASFVLTHCERITEYHINLVRQELSECTSETMPEVVNM